MSSLSPVTRQRFIFGLLIVAVIGTALLISRYLLGNPPVAERQPPVRVARLVESVALNSAAETIDITGYGVVEAAQATSLAPRVGGEIIEISDQFAPGAKVTKGQLLLRIDPRDYELAVREAEAALASARSSLAQEKGQQVVARADAEILGLEVSEEERQLMLRQPQLESALAQVDNAEAGLAQAQLNLERTEIRAPYDGQIVSRSVSVGAQLNANSSIGDMVAMAPYWITLRLPVDSLKWIDWPAPVTDDNTPSPTASAVTIEDTGDTTGPRWKGRVVQLLPGLESDGRRAGVLVQIDDPHSGARPLLLNSYAQASIHGRTLQNAFRLDTTWLHENKVWKIENGQLREQAVDVAFRGDDHVIITGGLSDGDDIVTSVPSGFVEGMKVRTEDAGKQR